jgi:hypothetical protein
MVQEKRKGISAVLQTLNMGDESASLNGKDKLFRCPLIPAFKNFFSGKTIKRYIQLYRVKIFSVKFKPLFLGKLRRIEDPIPPMGIIVATCTNVKPLKDFGLRISDCGI